MKILLYCFVIVVTTLMFFGSAQADLLISTDAGFKMGGINFNKYDIISTNGTGSNAKAFTSLSALIPPNASIDALQMINSNSVVFSLDIAAKIQGNSFHKHDLLLWNGSSVSRLWDGSSNGLPENSNLCSVNILSMNPLDFSFSLSEGAVLADIGKVYSGDILRYQNPSGVTGKDLDTNHWLALRLSHVNAFTRVTTNSWLIAWNPSFDIYGNHFDKADLYTFLPVNYAIYVTPTLDGSADGIPSQVAISAVSKIGNFQPPPEAPVFTDLPDLKLFIDQPANVTFDLADYNSQGKNVTYIITNNFMFNNHLTNSIFTAGSYSKATEGWNTFVGGDGYNSDTATSWIKYSTYKIGKLPQAVLRPNGSVSLNMTSYVTDSAGGTSLPPSFTNNTSVYVSDDSQLTTYWSGNEVIVVAQPGFNIPSKVFVTAAPALENYGWDADYESIEVYPALSTTAFEFTSAGDTSAFGYQLPAGVSSLANVGYVTSTTDPEGKNSHGGALKITFANPTAGIKITPKFASWLPNIPGSWYTLRVRVFGTNTINNYLQLLYNGNPGVSPTDVEGYFKYSMPTTWTHFDIPVNSYSAVSSAPCMYPQIVLKANGGTGTVFIDDMEIFQATPPLIQSRSLSDDDNISGYWSNGSDTTKWGLQILSGSPTMSISSGKLLVNTSGAAGVQSALKYTASTTSGKVYTLTSIPGRQVGMHMQTNLTSGTPSLTLTQAQVNMLGASGPSSGTQSGEIGAAAEIGRISPRTLRLAFDSHNQYYQVQFVIKSAGTSTIQLDNCVADTDKDDPNFGDAYLFP